MAYVSTYLWWAIKNQTDVRDVRYMHPVHADIFAPMALEGGPSERQHLLGVGREDSNWGEGLITYLVVLVENPQPCLDPPTSEWHDGQRRLLNWETVLAQRTCAR